MAKFDRVVLGELSVELWSNTSKVTGKFKLVSDQNGLSYGSTTLNNWSPAVLEKLKELKALMEEEAERIFFEDSRSGTAVEEVGGLGEQFGNEPPSV